MFPQRSWTRRDQGRRSSSKKPIEELLAYFQTDQGELDTDKVMDTVYHVNKIYYDVQPFLKSFKKR